MQFLTNIIPLTNILHTVCHGVPQGTIGNNRQHNQNDEDEHHKSPMVFFSLFFTAHFSNQEMIGTPS
ncbi:MAG: hypothetical protein JSC085_000937 [Candidatus Tokpelaia sp. JSC085]|nr:MAG: hypothetical protein JSC085_000937 [Candidatus Tokpelaia sp. JSC085]